MYWFLLISNSDIKRYDNLYLSLYRRWWSSSKGNNIKFSDLSLYRSSSVITPTQVWPNLSENLTVKSYGTFALWGCHTTALLIIHLISFEVQRRLSKSYSYTIKTSHDPGVMTFNEWSLSHGRNWNVELCIPWTNTRLSTKYFVTKCGFSSVLVHIWPSTSEYFLGLDAGAFHTTIKGGSLPSSCSSQFVNREIAHKQCKLRIEDISNSLGQDLRLKYVLIIDSICHQMSRII